MALNKGGLQSEILRIFGTANISHVIAAQNIAFAIGTYWFGGQHAAQGGLVFPSAAIPILQAELLKAWAPFQASAPSAAEATATAIGKALLQVTIIGSPFGVGGVASATSAAGISLFTAAFVPTPTVAVFAEKFASGVAAITATNQVFGTGTPPAPPPVGPFT